MVDAILRITRTSNSRVVQRRIMRPVATSLPTTAFFSPFLPWYSRDENTILGFSAAVAAVPYSEEVGVSVVDRLLLFAKTDTLGPYIPIEIWAWLKKQPSLPLGCRGRREGTGRDVVQHVRGLGDLDILKSYFNLVWSQWNTLDDFGFAETQISIAEDLGGIGEWRHREDLIKWLDYILGELDQGLGYFIQHGQLIWLNDLRKRKGQYRTLREVLLRTDQKATKNLAGTSRVDRFRQALH